MAMSRERWRLISELFEGAVGQPAEGRGTWLAAACQGDAELLKEVKSLLANHSSEATMGLAQAAGTLDRAPVALVPGQRLGNYEVLAPLGAGGMGEVYRARDVRLGREVAVKTLRSEFPSDPDRLARFDREARALAALSHANIASIHGFEESDGVRALVLELVEGDTLAERIARAPNGLPVPQALDIAAITHPAIQFLMAAPFAASTHRSLVGEAGTAGDNWHPAKTGLIHVERPRPVSLRRAGAGRVPGCEIAWGAVGVAGADSRRTMSFLSRISAGAFHNTAEGRRVFSHGLVGKRYVFVTAEEERRLRRMYEMCFVAIIVAVVLPAAFVPLWFRALVIFPAGMVLMELVLRRRTATLPPAPGSRPVSFADANQRMATESGKRLLWAQLAFFVAMVGFLLSGIVSDEDLGWHRHMGLAVGVAMIAQVSYQLILLSRSGH
jgi:hypothetical protein